MGNHACVPADLVLAPLLAIHLLDHGQWDHDLVVLERIDRIGIVQEDVSVENVDLFHAWARSDRGGIA